MDRRTALRGIVLGSAWPVAAGWTAAALEAFGTGIHASLSAQGPFRAFDDSTAALVSAACDRIIPADDTPGALAAGVPRFIDTIMADWETPTDRDRFLAGLTSFDREAIERHGRRFGDCTTAVQDDLLSAVDSRVAALPDSGRASHWFHRLKYLTVYGYCTSEAGLREELREWPMPGRYDGNAPYTPRRRAVGDDAARSARD